MITNRILITGGAGYIGSHTLLALINNNYYPIVIDNLSNANQSAVDVVADLTGQPIPFVKGDILDTDLLTALMQQQQIGAVIHFAGLKAVGESVEKPLKYYKNNVGGTISLLTAMQRCAVKTLIFSSSATVYGAPKTLPIKETAPLFATNPYGQTKLTIEHILCDVAAADGNFCAVALRYFNPIGADESGKIGENPKDSPNNLMPYLLQVATGARAKLSVFGDDYATPDGTGVRDYIHVSDLAAGHVLALQYAQNGAKSGGQSLQNNGFHVFNLGTGRGTSVLELVRAFEVATGVRVPYSITERRAGDVAACYADPSLARDQLGFVAQKGLAQMCKSGWDFARAKQQI